MFRVSMYLSVTAACVLGTLAPLVADSPPVYHRYVGNLHSHTSYSDGKGTPAQAFVYARDNAGIDFLAVTDHSGSLTNAEYADILHQAAVFNQDGSFVAIGGQEWTGLEWDHCNILDADHVFRVPYYEYDSLYSEILASGCTATFNHPQPGMFNDYAYSPVGDPGINAVEVRTDVEMAGFIKILDNGWHVGADGSQDNHSADWGDGGTWTVAWACSLTKPEILGATRNFRTYSTADRDFELTFTASGHWMGESFSHSGNLPFIIAANDPDGDHPIVRIDLYQNSDPIAYLALGSDSCVWQPGITPPDGENYYFVRVLQQGSKYTYTSPIWITCTSDLPATPALCSPSLWAHVKTLNPTLVWHPADKASTYILQYSRSFNFPQGPQTLTVAGVPDTCYTFAHMLGAQNAYYWRVRSVNGQDTSLCSAIWSFETDVTIFPDTSECRLTDDADGDTEPSMFRTPTALWLVWSSARTGDYEIFYKTSADSGTTWSGDHQLTDNDYRDACPSAAQAHDGSIWTVWSMRRTGGYEIYYTTFNGSSWSEPTRLTQDQSADLNPTVVETPDSTIWVAWSSNRQDGNFEIYYQTFDGSSWSAVNRLTDAQGSDSDPVLANVGDRLWAVWSSDRTGDRRAYYKVFDGLSWSADSLLADSNVDIEHITILEADDGQVWLAYGDGVGIYYRIRPGELWSDESRLATGAYTGDLSSLAQSSDGRVWLAYSSARGGASDIYAQRTEGSLTAAVDPSDQVPTLPAITLLPARPNPFTDKTLIAFALREGSQVEAAVYDVLGRKVRTLFDGRVPAGEHVLTWDGRDQQGARVASGVYVCRMACNGACLTSKIIFLR